MDLSAYLLDRAIAATTPPGETEADSRTRAGAIAQMLHAYAPGDLLETMMACQCIMMQFVTAAAMRDANNSQQEPAAQAKARAGAITASRVLRQWVSKFENQRRRNELSAAQKAKAGAAKREAADQSAMQTSSEAPAPQPAALPPARNGRIDATTSLPDPLPASAAVMRSAVSGPGFSGSDGHQTERDMLPGGRCGQAIEYPKPGQPTPQAVLHPRATEPV